MLSVPLAPRATLSAKQTKENGHLLRPPILFQRRGKCFVLRRHPSLMRALRRVITSRGDRTGSDTDTIECNNTLSNLKGEVQATIKGITCQVVTRILYIRRSCVRVCRFCNFVKPPVVISNNINPFSV